MTQTETSNSSQPEPSTARDPAADTDPLLHLYKMSTTAGVGSGEYVAINITAVVAVFFGLASFLAYYSVVLLVIPLVGVVLSMVAISQIRHSNGTQTGRGLAWAGLALSGIISAVLLISQGIGVMHRRADETAIGDLWHQFGVNVAQNQFDAAYDQFDSAFHSRVSRSAFRAHLDSLQHSTVVRPIESVEWNGLAYFADDADGAQTAEAVIKLHYHGVEGDNRMQVRMRKQSANWQIDNIREMFPSLKGDAAAAAAGQGNAQ